jgi:hypothetical protein
MLLGIGKKMTPNHDEPAADTVTPVDDERRKFLASCGKFAVVTPPAITMLLSTSLNSTAIAHSGGRGGDSGGRGDHDHGDRGHGDHGDEDRGRGRGRGRWW